MDDVNNLSEKNSINDKNTLQEIVREIKLLRKEVVFRKTRWMLFVSIILFVYGALGIIGATAFIFIPQQEELSENNTVEFTATIAKIQPLPYAICLEEYDAVFYIYSYRTIVDMDALGALTARETITFRLTKDDAKNLDRLSEKLSFVALKTDTTEIITLDSYNEETINDFSPIIIFIVMSVFLLTGATLLLVAYKRKKRQNLAD